MNANLANLKRQHREMMDLVLSISDGLTEQKATENAFQLSMQLATLSGKLGIHLGSEDELLYPQLINHNDTQIQKTAVQFNDEMGDIARKFNQYKSQFMGAAKIKENPSCFVANSEIIFEALKNRIASEEQKLFPLMEKI